MKTVQFCESAKSHHAHRALWHLVWPWQFVYSHDHAQGHICQEASKYGSCSCWSAQGATAPFTHICSPTRGAPKAQSDASLEDRILQLTETLYRIDLNGKPPRKPFKLFITQPKRRFKPGHNWRDGNFTPSNGRSFPSNPRGRQQGSKGRFKFRRPFGKFDKNPNTKCPRVSGRPFNRDKIHCFRCKEFGHMQKYCPELNRPPQEDITGPKKFEDYTYTYSGPNVQPNLQRNYSNQQMATNYEQALGAIKDSLSTANPLASLNLWRVTTIAPSCCPPKF